MENLEHGWLVNDDCYTNEFVGYCVECEEPLYESDDYEILCRSVYCAHCAEIEHKKMRGEL